MAQTKFMFVYHIPCQGEAPQPSPAEMQAMLAQWEAWKQKFKNQVVELGDGLKLGGRVLTNGVITDGPYVESKDIVGGYSIISAASYDEALSVARECPMVFVPGASIEIRELAGY
ncbi:MAG: hypothetical protein RL385_1439 [Pseudomonadota bacterium]|jgi:hypothetical protein